MRDATAATASRTVWLSRLLLTVAIAVVLGAMLADTVDAEKNTGRKPTSIAARVKTEKTLCENGGGTIHVSHQVGSATSTCTGGDHDGRECTHTKKSTVCTQSLTQPQPPRNDVGGPPLDGGNEDPTGGGATPGGGGGIDPGWDADPDGSDGGVILTAYDGNQHDTARHHGKRRHHRHGHRSR